MIKIHGKEYITVAERVQAAHDDEDLVSITTEVIQHEPVVVMRATVTFKNNQVYTGTSSANPNKAIEKSNPYEVAETSAVGRALGFAGYGIVESIASADEMVKAGVTEDQDPQWVREPAKQTIPQDKRVCSAHDEPVIMLRGVSKTKTDADGNPKVYWWHKGPEGQICFGQGYQD